MNFLKLLKKTEDGPSFIKVSIAGFFMGMANLVPGVSGGTMILALGLYEEFIEAFSSITRFKFTRKNVQLVVHLFFLSFLTIFIFAGIIQFLMENFLSEMLGLFIGLTMGGAPMLKKEIGRLGPGECFFILFSLSIMAIVAFVLKPGGENPGIILYFLGGFIGSAAMILPGISGSYLLLVMGLYLPVISAINDFKHAIKLSNFDAVLAVSMDILIPFSVGLILGIVFLSNLLKFLLKKKKTFTIAFLLGILLGSVLGLYPFKLQDFSKLEKYKNRDNELIVRMYGLEEISKEKILNHLKKLNRNDLRVNIRVVGEKHPTKLDVKNARMAGEVLMIYNKPVPREIRDFAKDKNLGKVPLIIVPDTNFSVLRLVLVLILAVAGFFITKLLGKEEI